MLSATNRISVQIKKDDNKFTNTKLRSTIFGGERKYNAILRANMIKKHFIDDLYRGKEKDVEDEIKSKISRNSINEFLYNNNAVSVSMFFEDIPTGQNYAPNNNVIFQYNSDNDIELSQKIFDDDNNNSQVGKILEEKPKQNSDYREFSWNTNSTAFVTKENDNVWKDVGFKDIMESINLNTNTEQNFFLENHDSKNSYKQVINTETENPLESVNIVFLKMLESMLLENFHEYSMVEKEFESIRMNDFAIGKYMKYCYSQNLIDNDPKVELLLRKYLKKHKEVMKPDIFELETNDLFKLSKNNVKDWFLEKSQLILRTIGEPDWIMLNLDLSMVIAKYKWKANNKLRADFLNFIESFLQGWWQLEIDNSKDTLRKGLIKYVKNIRIQIMQETQLDDNLNVDISANKLFKKFKGKSFKQIFLSNDRKVGIHGILVKFLRMRRYIFEDISHNEIVIVGKN